MLALAHVIKSTVINAVATSSHRVKCKFGTVDIWPFNCKYDIIRV